MVKPSKFKKIKRGIGAIGLGMLLGGSPKAKAQHPGIPTRQEYMQKYQKMMQQNSIKAQEKLKETEQNKKKIQEKKIPTKETIKTTQNKKYIISAGTKTLIENYKQKKKVKEGAPEFKLLMGISNQKTLTKKSIRFYGRAASDARLRKVAPEIAVTILEVADKYYQKYGEPLNIGNGWDYTGHATNSMHYNGLALDFDVGPNVGTKAYKSYAKERFKFCFQEIERISPEIRIIFGEKLTPNTIVLPGHHNHVHIDLMKVAK